MAMRTDSINRNPGGTRGGLPRRQFSQKRRHAHRSPARDSAVIHRVVWAEIDREARKGKPLPSDHAPVVIDIDSPGHPFDAGWSSADSRIAARLRK